jgi:hypothetical protein
MSKSINCDTLFSSRVEPSSVLGVLRSSIENLHSLRRGRSCTPSRLKRPASPGYQSQHHSIKLKQSKTTEESDILATSVVKIVPSQYSSTVNSRFESPALKRSKQQSRLESIKNKSEVEKISKKISFESENQSKESSLQRKLNAELIQQAQNDLKYLNKNQYFLESKVSNLNEHLSKLTIAHIEEQNAMLSIMHKLDRLENIAEQENNQRKSLPIPLVIEKVSKLENNYTILKTQNVGNSKSFKDEIKDVNHKIQDLKECNEILKELVVCLQKEPNIESKVVKNAETFVEDRKYEPEETVKLAKLDPDCIVLDLMKQKEDLVKEKEKMENEYKSIPSNSKSMLNKRRKQKLEMDLSLNYNKLMSVSSKIKKLTN